MTEEGNLEEFFIHELRSPHRNFCLAPRQREPSKSRKIKRARTTKEFQRMRAYWDAPELDAGVYGLPQSDTECRRSIVTNRSM